MAKIRIVSRPKGEAPEWVRDEWIGCEIPIIPVTEDEDMPKPQFYRVISRMPSRIDGYIVDGPIALGILLQKSEAAYMWWIMNCPSVIKFSFDPQCCEIVV